MMRGYKIAALAITFVALIALAEFDRFSIGQTPPAKDEPAKLAVVPPVRPRAITPPTGEAFPGDPPDDSQVYVWPLPEKGVQSVIILRVVDGETIEGGYIVPVQFKLRGVTAPDAKTPLGKAATEALSKLLAGRLIPAKMAGRDATGRIEADFWLGKADKDNPGGWAAQWMQDQKLSQPKP